VDLPSANPEVSDDIVDLLGCKLEEIIHASENWFSVILAAIIERIPPPKGNVRAFTSFNFDSHYNHSVEVIPCYKWRNQKGSENKIHGYWKRVLC
jgi:GTP-binding protein LepA